jgi:cytochrome c553
LSLCAAVFLVALFGATQAVGADADLADRLAACASCHGERGEGVRGAEYQPHLAGKPAGYLFEQLRSFRDGRRTNAQMTWLVRFMDDAYLREIAAFYAAQPPRTRAADTSTSPLSESVRQRAEALVTKGDPARDVPACVACHGADLAGLEPGIPALVGLPAEYIVAQFGNWRNGIRHAIAPDCMADIATALAPEDIRIVAEWLARQSHVDGRRPAPAGNVVPPRACGDLPWAEPSQ